MLNKHAESCTAQSKRSGETCRNPAMPNGKCRMHGGKTPKAFASPNFIHGRHSKYLKHLPKLQKEQFQDNVSANELPTVLENIALTDLNIAEAVEMLDDSTMIERWNDLTVAIELARLVVLEPDQLTGEQKKTLTPQTAFAMISEIVNSQSNDEKIWNKINDLNERQRKLQLTSSRIQANNLDKAIKEKEYLPAEYIHQIFGALAEIFELAPHDLKMQQLDMLMEKFDALPDKVKKES